MVDISKNPMLIVIGVIALVIAVGVIVEALPDSVADWYGMVERLDNNTNVSDLFVLIMRYAPLGIALSFFGLFFSILIVGAKKKGLV